MSGFFTMSHRWTQRWWTHIQHALSFLRFPRNVDMFDLLVGGKIPAPPRFAGVQLQPTMKNQAAAGRSPLGGQGFSFQTNIWKTPKLRLTFDVGSVSITRRKEPCTGAGVSRNWNAHRKNVHRNLESVVFHCGMVRTCKPCPGTASCLSYWSQNLRIT